MSSIHTDARDTDESFFLKPFNERVYDIVKRIPRGKVATYGQIAALIGSPRASRFVGFALHANPEQGVIPCHRVVFKSGALAPGFAFGGPDRQRKLLEDEGVRFIDSGEQVVVDLSQCRWKA
ncbi:MGMT family protein [Alloscardovia venturai]|uniref:MGMT family protein n=1 Tax=Alloscardovia venturai TaxID=1769421 RepID=A0ABW2Y5G6_9BIFI